MKAFESEFLRLAGCFFSCRLEIMGGFVVGKAWARWKNPVSAMEYSLLGEMDNLGEMRLMCRERIR